MFVASKVDVYRDVPETEDYQDYMEAVEAVEECLHDYWANPSPENLAALQAARGQVNFSGNLFLK